ncbi:hypothetical protein DL546_004173 [Coniochaeta pulveracea]|uniref:Mid2 domain-containing protein n=1 Tax=Coniochaeta pulveracea TaxID=177199 RepID=A0A420Y8N5_9PEZI|nr:hypothetical protein DL546_004173 [Coniochaeta pulveracea]
MAMLTFGVDQTYEYFHCDHEPATAHLEAFPRSTPATTTSTPKSTPPTASQLASSSSSSSSSQPSATSPLSSTTPAPSTGSTASMTPPVPTSPETQAGNSTIDTTNDKEPNKLSAIIGGAIAGLVVLCAFGGVVTWLLVRARLARLQPPREQIQPVSGGMTKDVQEYDGWGPRELPTEHYPVRVPVELHCGYHTRHPVELPASHM